MNLNNLNNTIEFLQKLKEEEEKKQVEEQVEEIKNKIKEELISKIDDLLMHFESNSVTKFREETKKIVCFDYNYNAIMYLITENLEVNVWEVK